MPPTASSRKVLRTKLRRQLRALRRQIVVIRATIDEVRRAPGRTNAPERLTGLADALTALASDPEFKRYSGEGLQTKRAPRSAKSMARLKVLQNQDAGPDGSA